MHEQGRPQLKRDKYAQMCRRGGNARRRPPPVAAPDRPTPQRRRRRGHAAARWRHFGVDAVWLLNGVIFYVLLLATGQWQRVVPTSWDVFPHALSVLVQYLSLDWPTETGWVAYNALQLMAYFVTVFVAAPLALITGLGMSPALSSAFGESVSSSASTRHAHCTSSCSSGS